jgi:pseudouridine-5'-phosphate glycosidase
VDEAVAAATADAARRGIHGAALTPYLLSELVRLTGGASLAANLALLEQNAALAGEISVALGQ